MPRTDRDMEPIERLLSSAVDNLDAVIETPGIAPKVEYLARLARELVLTAAYDAEQASASGDEAA